MNDEIKYIIDHKNSVVMVRLVGDGIGWYHPGEIGEALWTEYNERTRQELEDYQAYCKQRKSL